jgi:hypothetical protein
VISPQRFMSHVSPEPMTGCWLWTGAVESLTGRKLQYAVAFDGKKRVSAHRASWRMHYGEPGGAFVLHKCDQPTCVNPAHLFLGTHAENMADMARKGRRGGPTGERVPNAKLRDADIPELLNLLAAGESQRAVARRFGVSQQAVWFVAHGKTWRRASGAAVVALSAALGEDA